MINTEKATELVNEINKYKESRDNLIERSNDEVYKLRGICAKNKTTYGYYVVVIFEDGVVLDSLKRFIEDTINYYNDRIKFLTEELSNL